MTLRHWGYRLLSWAVPDLTRAGKPPVLVLALLMGFAVLPVIWILFNIASYVGCSAEKSDSGAMKIMKISDSSA